MPELFIAALNPASLEENTSNLPMQNISNIFNDHGPIPKTPRRVFFKLSSVNFVRSSKRLIIKSSEISLIVFALFLLKPKFLISSILRF